MENPQGKDADIFKELRTLGGLTFDRTTAPSQNPYTDPSMMESETDKSFSQSTLQQTSMKRLNTNDVAIAQREREIEDIAQGIIELADIFKELQGMVIDQGTMLDRIDYNVENMSVNVKAADKELNVVCLFIPSLWLQADRIRRPQAIRKNTRSEKSSFYYSFSSSACLFFSSSSLSVRSLPRLHLLLTLLAQWERPKSSRESQHPSQISYSPMAGNEIRMGGHRDRSPAHGSLISNQDTNMMETFRMFRRCSARKHAVTMRYKDFERATNSKQLPTISCIPFI